MQFGIFLPHQLPRPWPEGAEREIFLHSLEQGELADRLGIDFAWGQEHHFLEEYAHSSAPEVYLAALSQRTRRIRLGHGVVLMSPRYNPPARVAERLATLDLVSGGRVEWGTGESGTRVELEGFGISVLEKREMWAEAVRETARMLSAEPYPGHQGRFFSMPARNVVPKPLQRPHPPLWVACSSREAVRHAARAGVGALTFSFLDAAEARYWVDEYYETFKRECTPIGRAVNPNIAMLTNFMCHRDPAVAAERGLPGARFFAFGLAHYYRDGTHVPGETNLWERFQRAPERPHGGTGGIGDPESVRAHFESFEEAGVDQLILLQQAGGYRHEHICESLSLFGAEVLPRFRERHEARARRKAEALAPHVERAMKRIPPIERAARSTAVESYPVLARSRGVELGADRAPIAAALWSLHVGGGAAGAPVADPTASGVPPEATPRARGAAPDVPAARPDRLATFVELARARAAHDGDRLALTYLSSDGSTQAAWTFAELDRRARAIAGRLLASARPGDRALLLYPAGGEGGAGAPALELLAAFYGCLYAGVIAVPAYPPRADRSLLRLLAIAGDAEASLVLSTSDVLADRERLFALAPGLGALTWIATDAGQEQESAGAFRPPAVTGASVAFLQYTSGSTRSPRGVMVSHANLLHNTGLFERALRPGPRSVVLTWLPLYHDLGLVGHALAAMYSGVRVVLMSPLDFARRPLSWLRAISEHRATMSGAPNFAFELCVRRLAEAADTDPLAGLDLSCWQVALDGAEPIRADTLDRFAAAFAPAGLRPEALSPSYGLAEATAFASGSARGTPRRVEHVDAAALGRHAIARRPAGSPGARALVGCGEIPADQRVFIVEPGSGRQCPTDRVGEIWIAGPSVARGYWGNAEESARTFGARLADTGEGPCLRTGDLGFIAGGELFITGRLKDLVVLRGRNHYPQDIEGCAEHSHRTLRPGCSAAFAFQEDGEERLGLVVEVEPAQLDVEEIVASIRTALLEEHEVQVAWIALVGPRTIPKTSSGKIQRSATRERLSSGELSLLGEWRAAAAPIERAVAPHDRVHTLLWRPRPLAASPGTRGGAWILCGDGGDLAARVATRIQERGGAARIVPRGGDDARDLPADLQGLAIFAERSRGSVGAAAGASCALVRRVLDRLLASPFDRLPRLVLVSRGAVSAGLAADVTAPAGAAPWGLAGALAFEHPDLAVTCVDLGDDDDDAVSALLGELQEADGEDRVVSRRGERLVPRLAPWSPSEALVGPPLDLDPEDAYLVSGALGRAGLLAAEWLARRGARRIALLDSTSPGLASTRSIAALRGAGVEVIVDTLDLASLSQVGEAFERLRRGWPPIRGVVHVPAPIDEAASLLAESPDRLEALVAATADAAWNLHAAAGELRFFVVFSSAAAVLGAPGQGVTAAAFGCVDAIVHHRRARGLPALTVDWGTWADAAAPAGEAIPRLDPAQAFPILEELMRAGVAQAMPLPFDLRALVAFFPRAAELPLLAESGGSAARAPGYARRGAGRALVAPRSPLEQRIAGIFRQALRVDRVGVTDPFSELGGDSILGGEVVSRIDAAFGVEIGLGAAFESFTVESLARQVERQLAAPARAAELDLATTSAAPPDQVVLLEDERFRYKRLETSDVEGAVAVLIEAFPREPMGRASGLGPEDFEPFARFVCDKAAREGLSIVVIDRENDAVAACGLCEDYAEALGAEPPPMSPKMGAIGAVLGALDDAYTRDRRVERGAVLHLNLAAVRRDYEARQLTPKLVELSLDLGKSRGFLRALGHIAAAPLQELFVRRYGFREVARVDYAAFVYNGERVFAAIESPQGTRMLERELDDWRPPLVR